MQQQQQPPPPLAGEHNAMPAPAPTWHEEDEVELLKKALEMAAEPAEAFDPTVSPLDRAGIALSERFGREEILAKVKELRRRYEKECYLRTSRPAAAGGVSAVFEASRRLWGFGGNKSKGAKGKKKKKKKKARF